jgi:hypothetical protein
MTIAWAVRRFEIIVGSSMIGGAYALRECGTAYKEHAAKNPTAVVRRDVELISTSSQLM